MMHKVHLSTKMGRARVIGKGKLIQSQKEIEELKSLPNGSYARDEHIEHKNDEMGRTRAAKKKKLAHVQKEIEESESTRRWSNARDKHVESDNNVSHENNLQASKNIAVQTVVNFENNGARTKGGSKAAEDNAVQTEGNFDAVMDRKKKNKLTYNKKEIEESKSAHKASNAMTKHIEADNDVRNEDDPHASKNSASLTVKMDRTRAARQKKYIQKEMEEAESAPKRSNARDEHIEPDNNIRHEDNPQASKNVAIHTVVDFRNNSARTEGSPQAAEDNAMQTDENFDFVMDKKMGMARAMKKKKLTHKQKETEESKSALKVSNAMAKHNDPGNDVHNEHTSHASKNSSSLTLRRGRAKKKKQLPHKQNETEESKSTPMGSNVRNEHIVPLSDVHNEDNSHACKFNTAQTEVSSENNSAQVEYDPQSLEDNAVQAEGGFEPVMQIEELIQDEDKNPITQKKTRGPTKVERLYFDLARRINVEFNADGVPIGEGSVKLSSYLGRLVRKHVPVTLNDWRRLSNELKAFLWESIQAKFKLDNEWQKKIIFQQMGSSWRASKCKLVRRIIEAKTKEERFKLKPDNVETMEWSKFIESKTSLNFKARSEKCKASRSHQILHTCGRKGMARLAEDLKEQSADPSSVSRVHVWIKSHIRKDGEPVSKTVADTIERIQKIENESESSSAIVIRENALSQVLGLGRRSRLTAMGKGKTLTNVTLSQAKDKQIEQLQSKVLELEGMIHMLMKNQHGKENLKEESISQMSKYDKISDRCDLLDWSETDEIVAEGRVVSSDPNELVHKVPLGPNAMKILILVSRKSDAFLWRPTPSLTYIGDAEDRTVAWPASRVVSHTVQHSKPWDNGKTSNADKKCKLYDWSGSGELVAKGRLCSSDPKQAVNGIPLGPSAMAVWIDDPKKRDAFLWRPTSDMTFVGEAVGREVAWPESNVVVENFKLSYTAAVSPVTTTEHDAFLWRQTSGMTSVGEAVSRKAARPKPNVLFEKLNAAASPIPSLNATTTNSMPKNKCKLIDLIGAGEIVAEGHVLSTDPKALVHFVPLGRNAVKVSVDFVKVPDAILWRPSSGLESIKDAIGVPIAWPAANVIMESDSYN